MAGNANVGDLLKLYKYPLVCQVSGSLPFRYQHLHHFLNAILFILPNARSHTRLLTMQLTVFVATLLAAVASARDFTLYDDNNFGGAAHRETRNDDAACCMYIKLSFLF